MRAHWCSPYDSGLRKAIASSSCLGLALEVKLRKEGRTSVFHGLPSGRELAQKLNPFGVTQAAVCNIYRDSSPRFPQQEY